MALIWVPTLKLAFQSLGIVYGDIGTSPLYVFASTFTEGIKHEDDILGVLCMILYTITLIPLLKYVCILLHANGNGYGGTLALYSLLCRYAKVSLIPTQQAEDCLLVSEHLPRASKLKVMLENSQFAKLFLLFATMLGSSMMIGDGILTPAISVLSAVTGIKEATRETTHDTVVWISVAILVCLFMIQRFGTDRVSYSFAPIICVWFFCIGGIGLYNFIKYDPAVIKALNPKYIVDYFKRNKEEAWISLGGIVLSITGAEALFADVGHFSVPSIQLSMCTVTYPALIWVYTGQASFLRKHSDLVSNTFFESIPGPLYWPMLALAVLTSIIASQAMISGTFSVIQQSIPLGCFPTMKIVHTSAKHKGQVYIPLVNYLLMLACIGVTLGFRSTAKIGNAYGISVVFVMTLTSSMLVLIMLLIWKTNILSVIAYVLSIGSLELLYLSSVLYKFGQGGYLPLAFAAILMTTMCIWYYVHLTKYYHQLEHKISPDELKVVVSETSFIRLPGVALFYSSNVQDIPPIFKHYLTHIPVVHSVLILISIRSLPIAKVPAGERFHFQRVGLKELNLFSCMAKKGYMNDVYNERMVIESLKEFVKEEGITMGVLNLSEEMEMIDKSMDAGIVHFICEEEITAANGAGLMKRILIDYAYNFLNRSLGQGGNKVLFDIPHKHMMKLGMTCEL